MHGQVSSTVVSQSLSSPSPQISVPGPTSPRQSPQRPDALHVLGPLMTGADRTAARDRVARHAGAAVVHDSVAVVVDPVATGVGRRVDGADAGAPGPGRTGLGPGEASADIRRPARTGVARNARAGLVDGRVAVVVEPVTADLGARTDFAEAVAPETGRVARSRSPDDRCRPNCRTRPCRPACRCSRRPRFRCSRCRSCRHRCRPSGRRRRRRRPRSRPYRSGSRRGKRRHPPARKDGSRP